MSFAYADYAAVPESSSNSKRKRTRLSIDGFSCNWTLVAVLLFGLIGVSLLIPGLVFTVRTYNRSGTIQNEVQTLETAILSTSNTNNVPTTAAPTANPVIAISDTLNNLVASVSQTQLNSVQLVPASDQLCITLANADNSTLRATACSTQQSIGSLGCTSSSATCLVRFTDLKNTDTSVTLASNNRSLSISALEMYYVQWAGQISSRCPVSSPLIDLSLIEVASNTVIYSFSLTGYGRQQFCARALLAPGSALAFRVDDSSQTYSTDLLSISATISTTPDFSWLRWSGGFDQNLKVQWIPFLPSTIPANSTAYSPQYPTSSTVLPWLSNVIPSDFPATCPPPPGSLLPNCNAYDKRRSVQEGVGFFIYSNFSAQSPTDPKTSLFLTNRANRANNYRKKVYMAALTSRILPFYQEKVQNFVNQVYSGWVEYNKPLLSSFKEALVRFFLDLHAGVNDHPDYVIDYFSSFEEFVAAADLTLPSYYRSHINFKRVSEYMRQRSIYVVANDDTSTVTYWWHKAGFETDNLVFEMVHNIVAFSQFGNVMFMIARDMTLGTPTLGTATAQYDFIGKYANATTDADRLDVVRELYRLLVPNGVSFSFLREFTNPTGPAVQSRHVHQLIMLTTTGFLTNQSDAFNPVNWASYYQFDTQKYAQSQASLNSFSCPPSVGTVDGSSADPTQPLFPEILLSTSSVDNETVLDICNPNVTFVPQYPVYTPFGLGYRRCPGELLSYMIPQMMLARFNGLQFYIGAPPATQPTIGVAPFTVVPNVFYARAA